MSLIKCIKKVETLERTEAKKDGTDQPRKLNYGEVDYLKDRAAALKKEQGVTDKEANLMAVDEMIAILEADLSEIHSELGVASSPSAPKETPPPPPKPRKRVLDEKETKIKDELADLLDQFGKAGRDTANTGITPEQFELAGKIIAKAGELGLVKFEQMIEFVRDHISQEVLEKNFDALKATYVANKAISNPENEKLDDIATKKIEDFTTLEADDTSTPSDLEPDSPRKRVEDKVGEEDVQPPRGKDPRGTRQDGGKAERDRQDDSGIPDSGPTPTGTPSAPGVFESTGQPSTDGSPTRGADGSGSTIFSGQGVSPKSKGAKSTDEATGTSAAEIADKKKLQDNADKNIPIQWNNADNIRETLPMLLPDQQEDVIKTEQRFSETPTEEDPKKGILFTNKTGTGKTYTGLGIAKRFHRDGKENILVVGPTDKVVKTWVKDSGNLNMTAYQLKDTKDSGKGMVATTYANFRDNVALENRDWDLIIYDESHYLMSNEKGAGTAALAKHRKLANVESAALTNAQESFDYDNKRADLQEKINDHSRYGDRPNETLHDKYKAERDLLDKKVLEKQKELVAATKVVFLSATPFAYQKNLEYADGTLWRIYETQQKEADSYRGYNEGDSRQNFFMTHFGYRMRYNKLTTPEADVDQALMEREFTSKMFKKGIMSTRKLDIPYDYSREFVLVSDDALGSKIDEGYSIITNHQNKDFERLANAIRKKWTWLYKNQLLEAIKAKWAIKRVWEHINLGRKVAVFHGYKDNLPSHPFDFSELSLPDYQEHIALLREIDVFHERHPEFKNLDLRGLESPIRTFQKEFGEEVMLFNGDIPKKKRAKYIDDFNNNKLGKDLLLLQIAAGKEGISLHDQVGDIQRVIINLGLPYKPTDAIQMEGRTYRLGQRSNAIFEYPVLHLNFEKYAYSEKINERISTAENLASGEGARNLRESFKEGYKDVSIANPRDGQGVGGKGVDYNFEVITEFERAKTYYFSRQKRTARDKSKEGTDYFATPEPLGLKIVEWLQVNKNDSLLEPSAGHGAIGRFFPENTNNHFVEPSYTLGADLSINVTNGDVHQVNFEDYHVVNKFEGIAMNPPWGMGGKTAMEHTLKALKHLRVGGRAITIVPQGPSMDKRIDAWLESDESGEFNITARIKLPGVVFKRAGTSALGQVLVIDNIGKDFEGSLPQKNNEVNTEDINEFFDRIEEMSVPDRIVAKEKMIGTKEIIEQIKRGDTSSVTPPPVEGEAATLIPTKHTKTGDKIFVVKLNGPRVERDDFLRLKNSAREKGGYYSRYKGQGAIPGFIFKEEDAAVAFQAEINSPSSTSEGGSPSAQYSRGSEPIHKFDQRKAEKTADDAKLKLHLRVLDILHKYSPKSKVLQKHQGRKNKGVYWTKSGNVGLKSISDISTAFHELAHSLDAQFGIIENLTDQRLRDQLKSVYQKYYPGALPTHKPKLQHIEGYATLLQKFIEKPTVIEKEYPQLVRAFLSPSGSHAFAEVQDFLRDANKLVEEYFDQNPLDQMGSYIVDDSIVEDPKTGKEKVTRAIDKGAEHAIDKISPLESLGRKNGSHYTTEDAAQAMRSANKASIYASHNIQGKNGYWVYQKNGDWVKKHDFNWKTIYERLEARAKEIGKEPQKVFGHWLVARRAHFDFLELHRLEDELEKQQRLLEEYQRNDDQLDNIDVLIQKVEASIVGLEMDIAEISGIIERDNFSEQQVGAAYEMGEDVFAEEVVMYDALMQEQRNMLHTVGRISTETLNRMNRNKGYTSYARLMFDEVTEEGLDSEDITGVTSGTTERKGALGGLKRRKGSDKPIINPWLSGIRSEAEITRVGTKIATLNLIGKMAGDFPTNIIQPVEVQTDYNKSTGKASFPQERNPDYIITWKNGKRSAFLVGKDIRTVIEENFTYHNTHIAAKVAQAVSRIFRGGTTGAWIPFLGNNIPMDQITAAGNTQTGMLPFITSAKEMWAAATNPDGPERKYFKEYMWRVGTSQTAGGWNSQSFRHLDVRFLNKGVGAKAMRYLDVIGDIITWPSNYSEIMTRATEYIRARRMGHSQTIADEMAGRVSAPFHHIGKLGGQGGQEYIRMIPFANASIQVLAQTGRTLRTEEGRKRWAFVFGSIVASSTASLIYALDDEEDRQDVVNKLKALSPQELAQYIYVKNPYGGDLLKMRLPENATFFSTIINMAILNTYADAQYTGMEWGSGATQWAPDILKPFDGIRSLMNLAPQLVKGALEVGFNKTTYPTVRDLESPWDQQKPSEERFNAWSSPLAKEIGRTELAKGLELSPIQMDHLIGSYLGRAGQFVFGKPNRIKLIKNMMVIWQKPLYFSASRQIQFLYEFKRDSEDDYSRMKTKNFKGFTQKEITANSKARSQVNKVKNLLDQYRDLDEIKKPVKAKTLQKKIFREIDKMMKKERE